MFDLSEQTEWTERDANDGRHNGWPFMNHVTRHRKLSQNLAPAWAEAQSIAITKDDVIVLNDKGSKNVIYTQSEQIRGIIGDLLQAKSMRASCTAAGEA